MSFFLDDGEIEAIALTQTFVSAIWPMFVFSGFNVLICAYLTSAEKAIPSGMVALSRSLVLPIILVLVIEWVSPGGYYIYAFPIAEGLTFLMAAVFYFRNRPGLISVEVRVAGA